MPIKQGLVHILCTNDFECYFSSKDSGSEGIHPLPSPGGKTEFMCPFMCPYALTECKWCSLKDMVGHYHFDEPLCCALCQRESCPECWSALCEPLLKNDITIQAPMNVVQPKPSLDDVVKLQQIASTVEKSEWMDKGASQGADGI